LRVAALLGSREGSVAVYLQSGDYVDSDHPAIRALAARVARRPADSDKARSLYYLVRDAIAYQVTPTGGGSMADYLSDPETYRASSVLAAGHGFCASKASLFTALCRAAGIPARVAYADVANHHRSGWRIRKAMGTDLFAWHGYSEVYLGRRWVKVTPMFNSALCKRMGVPELGFDGVSDALLQPSDHKGRPFFSYVTYHGSFQDVPAFFLATEMPRRYPGLAGYRITEPASRRP
jgi:transglutaminase-like putative cysteine protease